MGIGICTHTKQKNSETCLLRLGLGDLTVDLRANWSSIKFNAHGRPSYLKGTLDASY